MSPTFHVLVFLLTVLICSIPLATFAQQDSTVAENEVIPAVLLIGDHYGVDETDVWQAALLVAKELRRHDIFVGDPVAFYEASAAEIVYYVVLRRSDENILFRLSVKDSTGTVIIEQEMLLADIEDIDSAAPRLVDALVHREPVTSSFRFISAGIFRTLVPVEGIGASGNKIGLIHDESTYAVGIEFRYADGETGYRRRGPIY